MGLGFIFNILILGVVLVSCVQSPGGTRKRNTAPSSASGGSAGGSLPAGTRSWSKSNLPLKVYFSSEFNSTERSRMKNMGAQWNAPVSSNLTLLSFPSSTVAHQDKNSIEQYLDRRIDTHKVFEPLLDQSTLAVTVYQARNVNGKLVMEDADILFNYYDHDFSTNPSGSELDLETVYLHELGHLLGLVHVTNRPSVMTPNFSQNSRVRSLNFGDQSLIKDNYTSSVNSSFLRASMATSNRAIGESRDGDVIIGFMEAKIHGHCRNFHIKKAMIDHGLSTDEKLQKLKRLLAFKNRNIFQ